MNTDYNQPTTATAAQHIANIKQIVGEYLKTNNINFILENLNILQACKDTIDILNTYQDNDIVIVEWWDSFEEFKITEI